MDVMTPVVVGVLLAFFTAIQTWINKGRFEAIERRVDRLESEVAELRAEVRKELGELRSMIMQLAIAIGAQPRPQTG